MITKIKVIFEIEEAGQAIQTIEYLRSAIGKARAYLGFVKAIQDSILAEKCAGPSFDIHRIHEPDIDGPKPDVSGEPDAIDPTVVIGDADGNSLKDKRREP